MEPLLSICIPTYNRLEILIRTIDSIYADVTEDMFNMFEVVVSDNSKEHECQALVNKYSHYQNFHYYTTVCEGFLNSYYALSYGKGKYLKLHNNTALLKKGALCHMINLIKQNAQERPGIFFTDGYRLKGKVVHCSNYEDFMYVASYFSSWSTGFGIWKDDFDQAKGVDLNNFFPQTSLFVTQNEKQSFIVDDYNLFVTQNVPQKGGYNIFKAFSVDYLNMIKSQRDKNYITDKCYNYIKQSLLFGFLSVRYFKTVIAKMDKFDHSDIKTNMLINYSRFDYLKFILASFWGPFRYITREFYRKHYTQLNYYK